MTSEEPGDGADADDDRDDEVSKSCGVLRTRSEEWNLLRQLNVPPQEGVEKC